MQLTTFLRSSAELAASRHRWTAQFPNLKEDRLWVKLSGAEVRVIPMGHHLVPSSTYGIDDFGAFVTVSDFEFLL